MRFLAVIFSVFIFGLFACNSTASSADKTETFKVWGNCEKCKVTIENSVKVDGVKEQDWNVESKLMTVKFDTTKITLSGIQQLIAKAGYDNDGFYGDDYAYAKLDGCCQYDRKPFEMK
ncbi:MAG: heavy-metal-associated protein [Bacteroidota bacterium]|jgi:copper chaperone CopZ|nr:heavy-metal-associated protein [Bacteroidota bacterium]